MEFLADYDDEEHQQNTILPSFQTLKATINIAPEVNKIVVQNTYEAPNTKEVFHNPEYSALWAPVQGPVHPLLSRPSMGSGGLNCWTGFVEDTHVDSATFETQFYNFNSRGFAEDPTGGSSIIGHQKPKGIERKKRKTNWDASELPAENQFTGPWAPYAEEETLTTQLRQASETTEEQTKALVEAQKKPKKEEEEEEREVIQAKSIFHGTTLRDYLGRTYVDHPTHLKPAQHQCFLPKKWIHTWSGHTKGVASIRFFPKYGHLILSAGMDTQVKIWDVYNDQKCLRTFMGHSKAVRDICFSNDGRKFLSASYDRNINLWDTETGECIRSFSNHKIPYCVKFHPNEDKQHLFLAGCSDKKITQWDTRSGKIVQEYDQHLGSVNTVTFIDEGRRFVTSSDDKSIRVWEWGIPVVIKYISEPHMHSMPSIAVHPSGKWFVGQSLDNTIIVYSTRDRFRTNNKKIFKGHNTAGYACQVDFSPDGYYVISGDCDGRVWIWDWKTCRVLKTLKGHEGVAIGAQWHPIEPSRMASCGWDGNIKYWD